MAKRLLYSSFFMLFAAFALSAPAHSASTTVRVSVSSSGVESNGYSYKPATGGFGNCIAFESLATNLVEDDTNGKRDIFVRDTKAGTTERVSLSF